MSHRVNVTRAACLLVVLASALAGASPSAAATGIRFSTPSVVDPTHVFGEPTVGIDPLGRVFASGPTGTGTQRSVWFGSPDGGHSFRPISPGPPPSPITSFQSPPGGGDTDLAFDSHAKQYFADLYALACLRTATTSDGGATASQSIYPAGCSGVPAADRQWLAVYDPPAGTPKQSPYTGPTPLAYMEYNNLSSGAQWVMSNSANDPQPGGPGLNYSNAEQGGPSNPNYAPWGADGYPAIDQVSGKVFQAASTPDPDMKANDYDLLLNIGSPDATGALSFLDAPAAPGGAGDTSKLIHIADHITGDTGVLFDVLSMDQARNLYAAWTVNDATGKAPATRQVWVSVASAASGWRKWSPPVQVSDASTATGDAVNIMPWIQAGGAGRADAVWYGSDKVSDPSTAAGQAWNVFMAQVVFPTGADGAVTGASPSVSLVKVSPHPMKYNDVCLVGTDCIAQQGNRNLADFFQVKTDASGAAEVIYDDTSNGLVQSGFTSGNQQVVDHAGAPLVTLARQSSGPGLFGADVSGPSDAPQGGLTKPAGDARYPVIGGTEVPGMDVLGTQLSLSGSTLTVTSKVVDLAHPAQTLSTLSGASALQYVTRWQMGNTLYYAAMEQGSSGAPTFYAGATASVDLCSVSACDPHVLTYPEPGGGGATEPGTVSCPPTPSASAPCTLTIDVKTADIGNPAASSLLEEVGTYARAASQPDSSITNAQAQADNVPLEIDGLCCFNFRSSGGSGPSELSAARLAALRAAGVVACASRRNFVIRLPRGLRSATVFVNRRRVRVLTGRRLRAPVRLTGLPPGRFTVRVVGRLRNGRRQVTVRRYRTCTPKRRHRYVPPRSHKHRATTGKSG
jgi:hypothetical protein